MYVFTPVIRSYRSLSCSDMPYIDSGLAKVKEGSTERLYFSLQDSSPNREENGAVDTEPSTSRPTARSAEERGPTSLRKGHARSASADNKTSGFFRSFLGQWAEKTVTKLRARSRSKSPSIRGQDSDNDSIGSDNIGRLGAAGRSESDSESVGSESSQRRFGVKPKIAKGEESDNEKMKGKDKKKVKKSKGLLGKKSKLKKSASLDLETTNGKSEALLQPPTDVSRSLSESPAEDRLCVSGQKSPRKVSFNDDVTTDDDRSPLSGGDLPKRAAASAMRKSADDRSSAPKKSVQGDEKQSIPIRRTGTNNEGAKPEGALSKPSTSRGGDQNKTDDDKSKKTESPKSVRKKLFGSGGPASSVKSRVDAWQTKIAISVADKRKLFQTRSKSEESDTKPTQKTIAQIGMHSVMAPGAPSNFERPVALEDLPSTSASSRAPRLARRSQSLDVV